MTKTQFIQLLDKLEEIYEQDEKDNKAWETFIWTIAPQEYAPIIEGKLSTVLNVLRVEHSDIAWWLSYYFYEARGMLNPLVTDKNWKNYNYSNKKEVVQSMIDFWYIK